MVQQLSVQELKSWLDGNDDNPVMLDVREAWEYQICALSGSVHIPMRQIPARLGELCTERVIVVLCHHGFRSQHTANFLQHQGFTHVYNLSGGINAWAGQVATDMPKY